MSRGVLRKFTGLMGMVGLALLLTSQMPAQTRAQDTMAESMQGLIAMVTAGTGEDKSFGAAVIVGYSANRLYLVTANHVLRRGRQLRDPIRVQLSFLPGDGLKAKALDDDDPSLDVAVMVVEGIGSFRSDLVKLPFDRAVDPTTLSAGDTLFKIGQPEGKRWHTPVTPDRYHSRTSDFIEFESALLTVRFSGGGLFNEAWHLVGMVQSDESLTGRALRIDRVIEQLRQWGKYPVKIRLHQLVPPCRRNCPRLQSRWVISSWAANGNYGN